MRLSLSRFGLFYTLLAVVAGSLPARADEKSSPSTTAKSKELKEIPESVEDLRALQDQVKGVLKKVIPATVGLRVGGASGSGVILKDGFVLTAGHVSGGADRPVTIILHDGTRIRGKTLGANRGIDSGMIKITDTRDYKGELPYVDLGDSEELKSGQWCIAVGHPGGFQRGRSPVVRLGRIQQNSGSAIRTDCALVGGDSGGPLFDLNGKLIGIHSRIGPNIAFNIHVPANTYRDTWDRLAKSEVWGGRSFFGNMPYMGVVGDRDADTCKIVEVKPRSPADKAGLKAGDIILMFDGKKLDRYSDLRPAIRKKKIGDRVPLVVLRDGKELSLRLVLGRRGG